MPSFIFITVCSAAGPLERIFAVARARVNSSEMRDGWALKNDRTNVSIYVEWTFVYLLTATTETGYIDSDTNSVMYRDIIKVLSKLVAKRFGLTTIRSCDGDDC